MPALKDVDYNLVQLIKDRQSSILAQRLNHDRLDAWDQTDPNLPLLRELVEGIAVPVDPLFVPSRVAPPISAKNRPAEKAVNKSWYELYKQGLIFLIPSPELLLALSLEQLLHFSPWGWTSKFAKVCGRCTSGYQYDNKANGKINTEYVTAQLKAFYGDILHPTILQLMEDILREASVHGWQDILLWKMDLAGAFNLLFFRPTDAGLLCHQLIQGANLLTLVNLVGNFGWTGTPFAFAVVTRAIVRQVRKQLLSGAVCMYCDDLLGVCLKIHVQQHILMATQVIQSLMGPTSVAAHKTMTGRCLDFIGWSVDLDQQLLGVARHNYLKALYSCISVKEGDRLSLTELRALSSRASRYSLL